MDVRDFIGSAAYPGRIVVVGRDGDGTPFVLYCLSGRSAASKERDFDATAVGLEVIDTGGSGDDPLRHYQAACAERGRVLVGNGDHVAKLLGCGVTAETLPALLLDVWPEPDPPILTPRIGVLATLDGAELVTLQGFGVTGDMPVRHLLTMEPDDTRHCGRDQDLPGLGDRRCGRWCAGDGVSSAGLARPRPRGRTGD